jgi:S1-C subfamily serine protease
MKPLITHFRKLTIIMVGMLAIFLASDPILAKEINYKNLFKDCARSVVFIYGTNGKIASRGSGTIITTKGLVLTNTHVVHHQNKPWKTIYVYLKPGKLTGDPKADLRRPFQTKLLATNPKIDLALLEIINPPQDLQPLVLSNIKHDPGEAIAAIGHPLGGSLWTLTTGKISGFMAGYKGNVGWDLYQAETSLNPGNSGGPMLSGNNRIIGVSTFVKRISSSNVILEGMNFGVSSITARKWINSIISDLPPAPIIIAQKIPKPKVDEVLKAEKVEKSDRGKLEPFIAKNPENKKRIDFFPKAPDKEHTKFETFEKSGKEFFGKDFDVEEFMKEFNNPKKLDLDD